MEDRAIRVKHKPGERYMKILSVLGGVMPKRLTKMEMLVTNQFNLQGGRLTAETRKAICERLDISPDNLNNYVQKLRRKSVIKGDELNPMFRIETKPDRQEHMLVLLFDTK